MSALSVEIPGLRLVSEANERGAWQRGAKRAAEQRRIVGLTLRTRAKVTVPCEVRIVRVAPGRLDDDNLARACKAVRDEVARWLGVDDRDERVTWHTGQTKGRTREYAVRITIRPWSTTRPGARVRAEADATRVEVVLTTAQRAALARALTSHTETRLVLDGLRLSLFTATGDTTSCSK